MIQTGQTLGDRPRSKRNPETRKTREFPRIPQIAKMADAKKDDAIKSVQVEALVSFFE